MLVIFPSDPLKSNSVDDEFASEYEAANQDFKSTIFDLEALEAGDYNKAFRKTHGSGSAICRMWMLKSAHYKALFMCLAERGINLITTPEQYNFCHHLPENYSVIESYSADTVWIEGSYNHAAVMSALEKFNGHSVIIKDWVKSEKHNWRDACYIADSSDSAEVDSKVKRFLELRGDKFVGGLVFRKYLDLAISGMHPKSGMPLANEFRLMWLNGKCIVNSQYWGQNSIDIAGLGPSKDIMAHVARSIPSPFFSMDLAQMKNGDWKILELGDGQVSGLPPNVKPDTFYRLFATAL